MADDIRKWLEGVGFSRYGDLLAFHGVDMDVLDELGKDDLAALGVPLGDRLRIMKAIRMGFGGAKAPARMVEANPAPFVPSAPSSDAERRPLTVMFCDLADSTALSTRLDPEDLQDVIRTYQETCTRHIQEYEGFVAKYMGDGILVYYGYPKSLERNAERAVRSALDIVAAMAGLNETLGRDKGIEIAVRVGIATGMVMVGEIVGEGMAQERTVIGEAPNVAARLQGLAERNGIVVGSLTRELTGDAFDYEDLGSHELKGISGLVQTWGVTGLRGEVGGSAHADDDEAIAAPVLIGRDEEIGLLRRAWQGTKDEGRGQVVTLSGEAGIGKSALIDGLKADVRAEGPPQLTMRCSPYHTNSALYPVIEHFKRLARWQPEDDAPARLAKLEAMLGRYTQPVAETVPLMASLLSLAVPQDCYPTLALTPQQQKQQTQDMIIGITMEVAESRSFLQLWEDLHWADPSTLELIGLLIEQAPTVSLLMVLTARPDFVPPWPSRSHITPITLNRLERAHAEALVARIAGIKPLPDEVIDHIVTKTDGVPLYVEELTKTILVSDILRDTGERFELTGPLSSLSIPDTLQESLMARLDRLPEVRELAQLGSVLGREFAYEMISGLSTIGDTVLQEGLAQLVDAELLYQRGRPPRAKYIFKHALIQDAAYQSLLKRTRQRYHAEVANLLLDRSSDTSETRPEILAHHFTEAGDIETALRYWLEAGQHALRRSENYEAIGHLRKGLALLPGGGKYADRELAMLRPLATAYMATNGYAAPETIETFERARKLCGVVGDDSIYPVMFGIWLASVVGGEYAKATEMIAEMHALVENATDPYARFAAHAMSGFTYVHTGDQLEARRHFLTAFELGRPFDPVTKNAKALLYGLDLEAALYAYSAWTEWLLGYTDTALDRNRLALQSLERSDQSYSQARALYWCSVVNQFVGEYRAVTDLADRAIESARQQGLTMVETAGRILSISAHADLGEGGSADELGAALADYSATGARFQTSYHRTLHARLLGAEGRVDEALDVLNRNRQMIQETGEEYFLPEVIRLQGELLLAKDKGSEEAPSRFRQAIDMARAREAKSLELRGATSLAKWHSETGDPEAARNVLSPVLSWFTQGSETRDLERARSVLEKL